MNKIYKVIYCKASQTFVAVSEFAKGQGKNSVRGSSRLVSSACGGGVKALTLAVLVGLGVVTNSAIAGEVCVTDDGTVVQPSQNATAAGKAVACGVNATAAKRALALGYAANAARVGAIAIGDSANASGARAVVIGLSANALDSRAVAVGGFSLVEKSGGTAIGFRAKTGNGSGRGAQAVAVGFKAHAAENQTVAVGADSLAEGDQSIAVGGNTHAKGDSSIAIGGDDLDRVATDTSTLPAGVTQPAWHLPAAGATSAESITTAQKLNNTEVAKTYQALTGDWLVHYENTSGDPNDPANYPAVHNGPVGSPNRFSSTKSGHGAVALGVSSSAADLATSFGTRANAYGVTSLALGVGSQAGVTGATNGEGDGAVAIGPGVKALGRASTAQGAGSVAHTESSIAIGNKAVAGHETDTTKKDAIAIGTGAKATGNQSISIGTGNVVTGNHSGAIGDPTYIDADNSYAIGNNNKIAVGADKTFILGNNVSATAANNVILGNDSSESSATTTAGGSTQINSATVGTATYSGFAGTASGIVSVGAEGAERQIINVAPGAINATSTDAINGSQLYSVAQGLDEQGYVHVNDITNKGTGDATTNKGRYDEAGGATGQYAVAAGVEATAGGVQSVAVGYQTTASGANAVAIGSTNTVGTKTTAAVNAVAIGYGTLAEHSSAVAIGSGTKGNNTHTIAIGTGANANASQSTAIGYYASATTGAYRAVAIGTSARVTHEGATALGNGADALNKQATALGHSTTASGLYSTAVGGEVTTNLKGATAIGHGSRALAVDGSALGRESQVLSTSGGGVALGSWSEAKRAATTVKAATSATPTVGTEVYAHGAATTADKTAISNTVLGSSGAVSVGTPGHFDRGGNMVDRRTRQITNLAAGAADTDAVNVAQLKAVATAANRENYFHVNDTAAAIDASTLTASQKTNLDYVDGTGYAIGIGATTAGKDAKGIANHGVAMGSGAVAGDATKLSRENAIAIGRGAQATNQDTIAIGAGTIASGAQATAFGRGADATALDASAFGVDAQATGDKSTSLGRNAQATNEYATATGAYSVASGDGATANGPAAQALADHSTALGRGAKVDTAGTSGVAVGQNALTTAQKAIAVGVESKAAGYASVALGDRAYAKNNNTTAIGATSDAIGGHSLAAGFAAQAIGSSSVALGDGADGIGYNTVAVGAHSYATNNNSTALGSSSKTTVDYSVALGASSLADRVASTGSTATTFGGYNPLTNAVDGTNAGIDNTRSTLGAVSVGGSGQRRQIINVAAGTLDTDAVNVAQLKAAAAASSIPLTVAGNTNADTDAETIAGTTYKAGDGTQQQLGETLNIIGSTTAVAGVAADATGNATAGAYSAKNVQTVVTNGQVQIQLAENPEFNSVVIGDATNNTTLTSTAGGLDVGGDKITNVGAGTISSTSTDAVNGSQIQAIIDKGFSIGADNGSNDTVALGETVKYTSTSGNIVTTVSNNQIDFDLANSVKIGTANPVTINGTAGTITGLTNTTFDPNATYTGGQAATQEQLSAVSKTAAAASSVPLTVAGNTNADTDAETISGKTYAAGDGTQQQLGETLNIIGSTTAVAGVAADATGNATAGAYSAKNVQTVVTNGQVQIQLAENPEFNSVVIGDATNNTTLTSTANGLDVGGDKITNVGAGTIGAGSTDAVNGSQLHATNTKVATNATNIAKGFNIAADQGTKDNVQLGDTVKYTSTSGNIVTTVSNNQIDFDLANSVAIGTANPVTINGTAGTITGLTNTTFDPNATYTGGQAATQEQLSAVSKVAAAADRDTYFHTNSTATAVTYNSFEDNKGKVDETAGAFGAYSLAAGYQTHATGQNSVAVGFQNKILQTFPALSNDTTALGQRNIATDSTNAVLLGANNVIAESNSVATIGGSNISKESYSSSLMGIGNRLNKSAAVHVVGIANTVSQTSGLSAGDLAAFANLQSKFQSNPTYSPSPTEIGLIDRLSSNMVSGTANTLVDSKRNSVLGNLNTLTNGTENFVAGFNNKLGTGLNNAQIIGSDVMVSDNNQYSVAIGSQTKVEADNSVALGYQSRANRVATTAGAATSAAPTVGSEVYALGSASAADKAAISSTVIGSNGAVSVGNEAYSYTDIKGAKVNVAANTRQITNLAAGAADTDAVNVAQLKAVANATTAPLTVAGNTNADTDAETLAGKTYTAGDGTQQQLGETLNIIGSTTAVAGVAADATGNATAGAYSAKNVQTVVTNGQVQIQLAENPEFNSVVIGDATNNTTLTSTANGLDVGGDKITNVGAGTISSTSTDAVNGSQLHATNTKVATNATNIATNATNIAKGFNITADQGTKDNVQLGDTVKYTSTSGNIVTTVSNNQIDFDLANSVAIGTANPVTINGTAGTITGLTNTTFDPNATYTGGQAATQEQLSAVSKTAAAASSVPLTVAGNTNADTDAETISGKTYAAGDGTQQQLGETLNIIGSTTAVAGVAADATGNATAGAYSAKNVQTVVTNGQVQIQLAENPEFNSVVIGDATNNTTLTSTANGLDVGGDKITNVGAGTISSTSTDAVNGSQIHNIANQNATNVFGGNATVNADGSTSFTDVGGTGEDNIHDAIQSINTTANAGFVIAGASATTAKDARIVPNDTLNIVGAATNTDFTQSDAGANIYTVVDANNTVRIGLANDLNVTSVTTGNTTIDNTGLTITGGPSVTTAGIDAGGKQITNVADGDINATSTDAVNGSQIHNIASQNATNVFGGNATVNKDGSTTFTDVGGTGANTIHDAIQSINTTANAGFTIAGASATTATDAKIVPTDTLNIVGAAANTDFTQSDQGKNIYTVVDANNTVRVGLANDLDVTSVKAQTVNATTSVTIGDATDPNKSTTLTSGANGLDVGGDKITNVAAGDISSTSTDAVNGSQIHNIASQNAANVFGGNATVNKDGSTTFTDVGGTGANNIHDAIQSISAVAGKHSTVEAGSNIVVTPTTTGGQTNYVVSTSQNMSLESVQVSQGLSVSHGATVDMGNNRIQNVAAGVNPSDAVNYAQLMSAYSYTNQLAAEANAGVASALATANLPQPYDPGASMVSVGVGHHGNQQAIAIGLSAISDNGRWILKGSLSSDTKSNVSAGVGVGYQW